MFFSRKVFQGSLKDPLEILKICSFKSLSIFTWLSRFSLDVNNKKYDLALFSYDIPKNDFFQERKEKGYVLLWVMILWVEWKKTFGFIAYVEKLDRFTRTIYARCARRGSGRYCENISESRVGLTALLDSAFDGESKRIFSEVQKKHEAK
jgi:hypothetical protein